MFSLLIYRKCFHKSLQKFTLISYFLVSIDAISSGDTPENKRRELRKIMLERTLSENFHELTQLCLIRDPNGRPTAAQLMLHPFFKQCRRSATPLPELLNPLLPITDNRTASHSKCDSGLNLKKNLVNQVIFNADGALGN